MVDPNLKEEIVNYIWNIKQGCDIRHKMSQQKNTQNQQAMTEKQVHEKITNIEEQQKQQNMPLCNEQAIQSNINFNDVPKQKQNEQTIEYEFFNDVKQNPKVRMMSNMILMQYFCAIKSNDIKTQKLIEFQYFTPEQKSIIKQAAFQVLNKIMNTSNLEQFLIKGIKNFSEISKEDQIAIYLSLDTLQKLENKYEGGQYYYKCYQKAIKLINKGLAKELKLNRTNSNKYKSPSVNIGQNSLDINFNNGNLGNANNFFQQALSLLQQQQNVQQLLEQQKAQEQEEFDKKFFKKKGKNESSDEEELENSTFKKQKQQNFPNLDQIDLAKGINIGTAKLLNEEYKNQEKQIESQEEMRKKRLEAMEQRQKQDQIRGLKEESLFELERKKKVQEEIQKNEQQHKNEFYHLQVNLLNYKLYQYSLKWKK